MSKITKIAIFSHASTDHVNWVLGLREGFRRLGIEVVTSWPHPTSSTLAAILDNFQPDVIFEINRSRNQLQIPTNIFHVCFIQDNRAYGIDVLDGFGGSQLYYSIIPPKDFAFSDEVDAQTIPFFPPANTFRYYDPNREKMFDLGLLGYISSPHYFQKKFLQSPILPQVPELGRLIDLKKELNIDHTTVTRTLYIVNLKKGILQYIEKRNCMHLIRRQPSILNELEQVLGLVMSRSLNRLQAAQKMLEVTDSCAFWGHENWARYPRLQHYYQGYLSGLPSLSNAIQSTRINVHSTGCNIHPRISDAMALGIPNAVFRVEEDSKRFGLLQFFEPDVDYIDVTFENCVEKIQYSLQNPTMLAEMSQRARKKMQERFTWEQKCREILQDISARM